MSVMRSVWSRRTESHKTDHKTVVVKSVLFVRKVRLSPSVVLAHAEFQNVIEIDRHRNVIYDFSV